MKEFSDAIKPCYFKPGVGIVELGNKHNRDFAPMLDDANMLYSYPAVDVFPGPSGDKRVDDAREGFEDVAVYVIEKKDDWVRLVRVHSSLNQAIAEAQNALIKKRKINRKIMNKGVDSLVSILNINSPEYCKFDRGKWDWVKKEGGSEAVITNRDKWQKTPERNRKYQVHPLRS
ncbi:hypothetical protein [Nocardiopsis quinghaiensis]|uniref:hypothetical protein n=1 Tax=Nocardiopsis quinghaiensis TaxID=464995 RepID=UPI00123A025C|nr:hypothetical protein [Nocardiopsis quinghaiensis]